MKRAFSLVTQEAVNHPRYAYRVRWNQAGKRSDRYFTTKAAAARFAVEKDVELINEGRKHGEFTDSERRAILSAREIGRQMEADGIKGFTIEAALDHYATHIKSLRSSKSVKLAINEFLDHREAEAKSTLHLRDLKYRLARFNKSFGPRLMASFNTKELDRWLVGIKGAPTTRANYRRILSNLFTFANSRGYCGENPVKATTKAKIKSKPPGILTPKETAALLTNCSPEILPAVAIGAFAGLRAAEIARLDWGQVNLERGFIEVTAENAKSAKRRLVEITDNLKAWLAPHALTEGRVSVTEMVYRSRLATARDDAKLKQWPANALRHSFATYSLAKGQNAAKTALQLGHAGTEILFGHYIELAEPKDGVAYFDILPPPPEAKGKILNFKIA
jgi:integrase